MFPFAGCGAPQVMFRLESFTLVASTNETLPGAESYECVISKYIKNTQPYNISPVSLVWKKHSTGLFD